MPDSEAHSQDGLQDITSLKGSKQQGTPYNEGTSFNKFQEEQRQKQLAI